MKASFETLISSSAPVLIDFFATWCGPCQTMMPILDAVKVDLGEGVKIIKIDVDKNQSLASQFNVRGVPTLVLYKNGKQMWRKSGLLTQSDLKQAILSGK